MINLLDQGVEIVMRMSDEAFKNLPVITKEDLKTKWERYRILLGTWEFLNPALLLVNIEVVAEFRGEQGYCFEGKEVVQSVNLLAIKKSVLELVRLYPEYRHLKLVGEIHYHPIQQKELAEDDRSWHLSGEDKQSIVSSYDCWKLNSEEPFLVGVGGAMEDGRTGYVFYRMIKQENKYFIRPVDWPKEEFGALRAGSLKK